MKSKFVLATTLTGLAAIGALTVSAQQTTTQTTTTTSQTTTTTQTTSMQATSQWAGVYTVEQADRGQKIYETKCSNCHLKSMYGHADDEANPPQPGLVAEEFWEYWEGLTLGQLFETISVTMPRDEPGILKPNEVADIIAHILRVNKAPVGAAELPSSQEALTKIKLLEKKPA